ncbi:glucose-1-phosphate adenylyltransferase [Paenibacillus cymbidii]|uniref:glucose-1-phosphate adenylyltransferase n=1 Tax=Paenibacillus cymbidii TaxID=1639034 RepID=UPI00107FFC82|nr:glucose-1-phosphate adenylyltransferase [Paenibacillus cymbidii]
MRRTKECVAMLLAGGEGRRLDALTERLAKPAVHFGGKYRMIDFALSNCANSQIDTVGVLTQYQPLALSSHIGSGAPWELDRRDGGITMLPPFAGRDGLCWYKGTASAVYENFAYLEQYAPKYVLILSADHIYQMDYRPLLDFHKESGADLTISSIRVGREEASRFGIMSVAEDGRVTEFAEKPAKPASDIASMGIYVFTWDKLRDALEEDAQLLSSSNDFGKDVIPLMIAGRKRVYAYRFSGYWKDVGTIDSLWEAHMDLISANSPLRLGRRDWPIRTPLPSLPPHYIGDSGATRQSLIGEGCIVEGTVDRSVVSYDVEIKPGSLVVDSVVMPGAVIGRNATLYKTIVGEGAIVADGAVIGDSTCGTVTVIGHHEHTPRKPELRPVAIASAPQTGAGARLSRIG